MKRTDIAKCCGLSYEKCDCNYLRHICCGAIVGFGHFEDCGGYKPLLPEDFVSVSVNIVRRETR